VHDPSILDLCCGTGIATKHVLKAMKKKSLPCPKITCVDFSEEMLSIARKRLPSSVAFHATDAASVPCANASFDIIYMGFGYRNLIDKENALMEIVRILKPNGRLFILELTQPPSPFWAKLHSILLRYCIPLIGKLTTGHIDPYRYLATSIENFNLQSCFEELKKANLVCRSVTPLSFGSCTLLEATFR
jgi:demethylmenaquinone methyltransferase / 2-methoxy-6-polyprenyl-1,4-benzoquinol methylase